MSQEDPPLLANVLPNEPADSSSISSDDGKFSFRAMLRSPFKRFLEVDHEMIERVKTIPVDPNETGWDRLKNAYLCYINGDDAVEYRIVANTVAMSSVMGFLVGGYSFSTTKLQNYARQYNANVFHGQYRANRHLADTMHVEFFRGGIKMGVRMAIFTGLFMAPLVTSITYRNDVHYLDCALTGAFTGAMYRAKMGPRASLVTAVVGSLFGFTFAGLMRLALKISGTSIHEMRHYNRLIAEDTRPVQLKFANG
ncbi:Complex I assembly factor timmdc1, mitochondrial [Tyrophagus putrescentiae]|nr:Complex I assembly factor timmdc1, mitochondrial [Tyrophagus putrescentiae]